MHISGPHHQKLWFFGRSGKCVWEKRCSLFQIPLYVMFQQNFFLLSYVISSSHLLLFSSHTKPRYYTKSFIPYLHTFVHRIPTLHNTFSSLPSIHSILRLSFVKQLLIFLVSPQMTNLPLRPHVERITLFCV